MSNNKNSQYDPGLIVKEVHDFYGQSLRVRDVNALNDAYFTHFSATYNGDNNPTLVTYYRGITSHITNIGCVADVSSSLNNKYFLIHSSPDNSKYHVWFNVDSAGVAPVVSNSTSIEIEISANDSAQVIATAIKLTINLLYSSVFSVNQVGGAIEIRTVGFGICANSSDVNTGFALSNTAGTQVVTDTVNLSYSGIDPVYNGQLLKNYRYNIWSGKFEPTSSSNVTIVGDVSIEQPVITAGTQDGTPTGTVFTNVNNVKQQILASHDREQNISYADFGTKNQRVTQIDYTSNTFPGVVASKVISYTLVGNRYRRDSIDWIIS